MSRVFPALYMACDAEIDTVTLRQVVWKMHGWMIEGHLISHDTVIYPKLFIMVIKT